MNETASPTLRILVDYPEPLLAMELAAALRLHPGFDVLAPCESGPTVAQAPVDIVVTDHAGGLARAREALRGHGRCRILVMAMYDREHDVRAAMEAGVDGYLQLGCSIEELAMGVRTVGKGARYLSLTVAQRMADSLMRESLTGRETDVLRLVALGQCNKSIARTLEVTVGTVKTHLRAIFSKLDAASRTEAVGIATQRGLIDALAPPGLDHAHRGPISSLPATRIGVVPERSLGDARRVTGMA
jgi:DNA-binding NarL/FixJ family response regulator